jgi:hypothetical protein
MPKGRLGGYRSAIWMLVHAGISYSLYQTDQGWNIHPVFLPWDRQFAELDGLVFQDPNGGADRVHGLP